MKGRDAREKDGSAPGQLRQLFVNPILFYLFLAFWVIVQDLHSKADTTKIVNFNSSFLIDRQMICMKSPQVLLCQYMQRL